jgi:molybdopterin converting factor small subunit
MWVLRDDCSEVQPSKNWLDPGIPVALFRASCHATLEPGGFPAPDAQPKTHEIAVVPNMITIYFLSGLQEIVGQNELKVTCSGRLSALLESLCHQHGEALARLLFESGTEGRRNAFFKILVNGVDVQQSDPDLSGDETVFLFLPIAGG